MSTIFVSIAAYRDPELLPTLRNCIETAANPAELRICIAWQHAGGDEWDSLGEYEADPRFRIIDIPYRESQGVCWARSEIQKRYGGEDYYLQLDSHHRFSQNWDDTLKDYLHYLQASGSEKPLLSAYLPIYRPENDPFGRKDEVYGLAIDRFMPQGVAFLAPYYVPNWRRLRAPFESRFISAHFLFAAGEFATEVPYDPHLYFHGEETSMAARAYTHGYDLFNPHRPIIWHEYIRNGKAKHWDDFSNWSRDNDRSFARYRALFGMDDSVDPVEWRQLFAKHGFGSTRTLGEYERYAGVKFKKRQIHKEAVNLELPPTKSDFDAGLTSRIKICIDLRKASFPETDYDFLAVAFLDKTGADIYRQDCPEDEIRKLFEEAADDKFIHLWRTFNHDEPPHSSRVWPHSKSKGWMDRIEQVIKYD